MLCKSLITSHLLIFIFISVALGDEPKKTWERLMSENVLSVLPSRSFMVSCVAFEFIFVPDERVCTNFIDLHAVVQLSQHRDLLRRLSFPLYILASFVGH